jgi:hypothetical protein
MIGLAGPARRDWSNKRPLSMLRLLLPLPLPLLLFLLLLLLLRMLGDSTPWLQLLVKLRVLDS